jgi:hypothetical protein
VNVEYFKYLDSLITRDARGKRKIISRIAMAKTTLIKNKDLFSSRWDLNLRKKLIQCYIFSTAWRGAEH